MPQELNEEQQQAVDALAETLNGSDPRADLLRRAARERVRRNGSKSLSTTSRVSS